MADYGARTGVTTLIKLVKHLCGLYEIFGPHIVNWVNGSTLPIPEKLQITTWLGQITEICRLIKLIPDD